MPPALAQPLSPAASSAVPPSRKKLVAQDPTVSRAGVAIGRVWFAFAITSLVLAGLLSLTLVVGRLPFLGRVFTDPLFFKRALVVHVDLALVVWFQAGAAAFLASPSVARCPLDSSGSRLPCAAPGWSACSPVP